MAGWYRIGSVVLFSFDGGLTWPIQTPLAGYADPQHVVCQQNAHDPTSPGDTRIANSNFARNKSGRHGGWGTDRKFYWSETAGSDLYICKTDNFGATWTGIKHPLVGGPASDYIVTHTAFDSKGTLYVLHGNKLYVSFNQGESIAYVHTLPRWGNAGRADSGADQFFVVDCGTLHIGLLEDAGEGRGNVVYLRGTSVDTASPVWQEELVDVVGNVRLDFMQIVLNGNGIPTISYTTPGEEVTTASRNAPMAALPPVNVALVTNGATALASTIHGRRSVRSTCTPCKTVGRRPASPPTTPWQPLKEFWTLMFSTGMDSNGLRCRTAASAATTKQNVSSRFPPSPLRRFGWW
jgi:hypothetical protein